MTGQANDVARSGGFRRGKMLVVWACALVPCSRDEQGLILTILRAAGRL